MGPSIVHYMGSPYNEQFVHLILKDDVMHYMWDQGLDEEDEVSYHKKKTIRPPHLKR